MYYREILLTLWVLLFSRTSGSCTLRRHINALEGEFFQLKDCLAPSQVKTSTVKWTKMNELLGFVELTSSSSPRIVLRNYSLEFWPLELNDSGSYTFHMGNYTYNWKLNVLRRDHECYSEKLIYSQVVEVGADLSIYCDNKYHESLTINTSLYTNCTANKGGETSIEKIAECKDTGYYTCVHFLRHNETLFNFTKTYKITVTEEQSINIADFHGPETEYIKVELGKDVHLNCSAPMDSISLIYWDLENKTYPNVHEGNLSKYMDKWNKTHASRTLIIKNVNERNLNIPYTCYLTNGKTPENKTFILLKKEVADISGHVFTRGMIAAIFISAAIVCLVILGIIYRVDLVLLYRRFMRRDETLTDGKTYDAFVSYLKECQNDNGEAHTFAVEILPRVLEKHFGYKLCIFERDVVPGKAVVDEVHSLIGKSRRLIIVLSKSYLSNEVRYELESGLHEALVERKIKIILIKFTSVSDFTFLPQSLELLKSHRVLQWKADKSLNYNSRFWKNLLYLMPAKIVKPYKEEELFSLFS